MRRILVTGMSGTGKSSALEKRLEWAQLHPEELRANWERAQALEALVPIEPLP